MDDDEADKSLGLSLRSGQFSAVEAVDLGNFAHSFSISRSMSSHTIDPCRFHYVQIPPMIFCCMPWAFSGRAGAFQLALCTVVVDA
jgi:hypothetical protein